ncbi:MAG: MBL fold metallo-hydrolase [Clostridiales Family XIII bacterium]|jgi:phosphoribosyl 1,2-cyclic phosphodiesterase|nr:MBL fold metallo-hydrolase [Clostridiales Family XIII bacterium]
MTLSVCAFSSGSSGNCYLVRTGKTAVLIDAGISASRILTGLGRAETAPGHVAGLFLTHEHIDHVRGVRVLMKKLPQANVFASAGTLNAVARAEQRIGSDFNDAVKEHRRRPILTDEPVKIGDMTVRAFRTLHDAAEPYGYSISADGKEVAIVTDTGAVTDEMLEGVAAADVLVLESNHDTKMLREGAYPWHLKQRILSEQGHLSNAQAAEALTRLYSLRSRKRVVLLAHLSDQNNTPALAERTVITLLAKAGLYTGESLYLGVLLRDEASLIYRL